MGKELKGKSMTEKGSERRVGNEGEVAEEKLEDPYE